MDVWGALYLDHLNGRPTPHVFERDDGQVDQCDSAALYFEPPRSDAERRLLDRLGGPALDLGAGAGSYALYLQRRGLDVTAADASPGAVAVCRSRGCRRTAVMDLRTLALPDEAFGSILVMGNTLGVHQTPASLADLFRTFERGLLDGGHVLCATIDPLDTEAPEHLAYHARNRALGRPPGVVTIRLRYRDMESDWLDLWMPTADEFDAVLAEVGWYAVGTEAVGSERIRLLRRRP